MTNQNESNQIYVIPFLKKSRDMDVYVFKGQHKIFPSNIFRHVSSLVHILIFVFLLKNQKKPVVYLCSFHDLCVFTSRIIYFMWRSSQRVGADEVYESKWIRTISIEYNSENNVLRIFIWYSDKQKNALEWKWFPDYFFSLTWFYRVFMVMNCVTVSYILIRFHSLFKGWKTNSSQKNSYFIRLIIFLINNVCK